MVYDTLVWVISMLIEIYKTPTRKYDKDSYIKFKCVTYQDHVCYRLILRNIFSQTESFIHETVTYRATSIVEANVLIALKSV